MEVVVYGGTFDPPTVGHEAIIRALLNETKGEIWVMPSADRADKPNASPANVRIEMVQAMLEECFENRSRVKLSRIEVDILPAPSRTKLTYNYLLKTYPNTEFVLAVGDDVAADIHKWGGEKLLNEAKWIICSRNGDERDGTWPKNIRYISVEAANVSSTDVRENVKKLSREWQKLVSSNVKELILEKGLYQ